MTTTLISWAMSVMASMQPVAVTPWANTYEASAATIVKVAEEKPVWAGPDGVKRTVATLLSLGWFEGRFDPKAKGDGKCRGRFHLVPGADGQPKVICDDPLVYDSFCMYQIGRSNFKFLEVTEKNILEDFEVCTRAAVKMILISKGVCKGRPDFEMLGHYASGGDTCGGIKESTHRINKAHWIIKVFPFKEAV